MFASATAWTGALVDGQDGPSGRRGQLERLDLIVRGGSLDRSGMSASRALPCRRRPSYRPRSGPDRRAARRRRRSGPRRAPRWQHPGRPARCGELFARAAGRRVGVRHVDRLRVLAARDHEDRVRLDVAVGARFDGRDLDVAEAGKTWSPTSSARGTVTARSVRNRIPRLRADDAAPRDRVGRR